MIKLFYKKFCDRDIYFKNKIVLKFNETFQLALFKFIAFSSIRKIKGHGSKPIFLKKKSLRRKLWWKSHSIDLFLNKDDWSNWLIIYFFVLMVFRKKNVCKTIFFILMLQKQSSFIRNFEKLLFSCLFKKMLVNV